MNRLNLIAAASLSLAMSSAAFTQDSFGGSKAPSPSPTPPASSASPGAPRSSEPVQQAQPPSGARPVARLHEGAMHGATPEALPGGQVISTQALASMMQGRQNAAVLFDVLGGSETLPNAVPAAWMSQPGSFDDAVQMQVVQFLRQATQGRSDMPLIFYCASSQCWMSWNAGLRAVQAGYTNVQWYRGGLEAWKAAGLPTQPPRGAW